MLNPKLCDSNFPTRLIFQNADAEFLLLPSVTLFQPLLLELIVLWSVWLPGAGLSSQPGWQLWLSHAAAAALAGEFLCCCSTIRFQTSLLRSCPQVTSGKLSYALNSGSGTNPTFQLERRTMRQELSLAPGSKVKALIY